MGVETTLSIVKMKRVGYMWITNCQVIMKDGIYKGSVRVSEGKIEKVLLSGEQEEDILQSLQGKEENILDAKGMYLSPGFIDVHIHGAGGSDTMDGTSLALSTIAKAIVKHGTTAFLPTTMTVSIEEINHTLRAIKDYMKHQNSINAAQIDDTDKEIFRTCIDEVDVYDINEKKTQSEEATDKIKIETTTEERKLQNQTNLQRREMQEKQELGAQVLGAHLEGPFVSPQAIGAQNPKYLLIPSIKAYKEMVKDCEEIVVSMTLAPELDGAKEVVEYLTARGIVCSAGHTKATYEEMIQATQWGISHATHLYNAMTSLNHREPGVVGAVFDSLLTSETISDGIHISYPALRIAYKQKSTDQMLLITDAMMACCMPDGKYALGGQEVYVSDGAARLENGALAGSVLTLDRAIANVYENCKLPLYEVVKMATYNPARFCKIEDHKGLIREGYDADLVLFDEKIQVRRVWIQGKEVLLDK